MMKRTTITLNFLNHRLTTTTVKGYHTFDMHGFSFVVHRAHYQTDTGFRPGKGWCVSETTCGARCYSTGVATREEAISIAKANVAGCTQENFASKVRDRIIEQAKALLGE